MKQLANVIVVMLLVASILGCQQAVSQTADDSSTVINLPQVVEPATVQSLMDNEDVIIVDVREDWEYAEGHIPDSILMPLGEIPARMSELPTDKTIIAVCRSGNRSGQAAEFLSAQGYDVHNMEGGMLSWTQAGYDVAN